MKAAITSSAILITFVFLSFVQCEKKFLKGKHVNKTSAAKTKNGKRWMQTYPMGYLQQQESIQSTTFNNPYGEQPFGGSPDTLGYGFNGFKDSSFHDIYNLNKQPYGGDDLSSNFAQDETAYLKPGIGDYPSDIQINPFNNMGSLRTGSYDMMTNIGLPIHEKPKTQKLAQAFNTLEQIALDDAALNPSALHKTPTSNLPSTDATSLNKGDSNGASGKLAQESLPLVKESEAATESVAAVEAKDDGKTAELLPKVEAKEDTTDEPTADKTKAKETAKQKAEITLQKDVSNLSKDSNKENAGENSSKDKDGSKVEKEAASVVSSKAKTQNGTRRQNWESELVDISDVGLPSFASNGIYDKEVLENSDLIEDVEKTPYKVKEKLISSLQKALSDKDMSADENKELEDTSKNLALEKGESSIELVEDSMSEEKEASGKPELSDGDGKFEADSKTAIIEQNLMKIDKPKLVHLLATFIRDNEMKEEDGQNEIKEDAKSKHLTQKSKNENLQVAKENLDLKVLATKLQKAEKSLNDAEKVKVKGIKGLKHGERGSSLEHDPYANIGNTDPLNADTDPSMGTRKTKKATHRFLSNEEDLTKAKEASDKEEDQDDKRKAAEALKLEKQLKEEKDAIKEKAAEIKEAKLMHIKNKQDSESSGDMKEGKEAEQENVDVEVQLERQELKKLKALEKAEKEKEIELKTYAVMVNKNKANEAAEKESNEEETNDDDTNDDVNKKASKSQKLRLVSPELVKAIADQLEKHKSENDQELSQESENSKEDSKIEGKEESKESEESTDHDNEKLKENEKVDDDSLNVQTLIEHMKQSLINAKKFKNKNALKPAEKSSKHHKSTYDDAYAQIGSQDINIKRSRKFAKKSLTRISSRDKKHHVHHTHPLKKH